MKKIELALFASVLLVSCSKTDGAFDSQAIENQAKANYTTNFKKAYPGVNFDQAWDYSTKNAAFSLPAAVAAKVQTRAEAAPTYTATEGEPYLVEQGTLDWLKTNLKEEVDHRTLGKAFYMQVPTNSFTIVPIFQGYASLAWDLHMVVDGVDIKVWEKSQNLWMQTKADQTDWTALSSMPESTNKNIAPHTINATAVKATPYTFSGLPAGKTMYFYLEIKSTVNAKWNKLIGSQQSSLDQMMLALQECPVPTNLPEGSQVVILGCEDISKAQGGDADMNDVVFMIYGNPDVPGRVDIEEGDPVEQKKTVRYMIEDLGATDDFDFNDIVVDVSEIVTAKPIYSGNVLQRWEEVSRRQEAVIRHLGGILPFKLTIGDTELDEHKGVLGANPDEVYEVSGWDINAHNVSVKVQQMNNVGVYNNVRFPKAGEAPMIIAVNPSIQWMPERQNVPEDWFYVVESE